MHKKNNKNNIIFSSIIPWSGELDSDYLVNFLGVRTRWSFLKKFYAANILETMGIDLENFTNIGIQLRSCGEVQKDLISYLTQRSGENIINTKYPAFNECYFEWIDLFDAVKNAKTEFVMIELGAGYGRWLVNAVFVLRMINPLPYRLVGVEAEPTHFEYMQQHFVDNNIDLSRCELINKAITIQKNWVEHFWIGDPSGWYGQAIQNNVPAASNFFLKNRIRSFLQKIRRGPQELTENKQIILVPGISLTKILKKFKYVNLIDMDVQGAELSILKDSIIDVNQRVKRIHIGTHSHEIEEGLRSLFLENSWICIYDYPCQTECDTPYGKIWFDDGVQSWINEKIS